MTGLEQLVGSYGGGGESQRTGTLMRPHATATQVIIKTRPLCTVTTANNNTVSRAVHAETITPERHR